MTNAYIGKQLKDGRIVAVYCHSGRDAGKVLFEHYKTSKKVKDLISLGDLSSIEKFVAPRSGSTHSWKTPKDNVTIAYSRERGDKFSQKWFNNENEFLYENFGHTYLFKRGKWYFCNTDKNHKFVEIDEQTEF